MSKYPELDWRVLSRCTFPVRGTLADYEAGYERDCGKPAAIEVSWYVESDDSWYTEKMIVCPEHFNQVLADSGK